EGVGSDISGDDDPENRVESQGLGNRSSLDGRACEVPLHGSPTRVGLPHAVPGFRVVSAVESLNRRAAVDAGEGDRLISARAKDHERRPDQDTGHVSSVATFSASPRLPHSGETRQGRGSRSPGLEKNKDLVDYLVGVMFLAIGLIVVLAVIGNKLTNV